MERTEPVTFWDPFPANLYGRTRAVAIGSSGDDSDAAYRAVLRDRAATRAVPITFLIYVWEPWRQGASIFMRTPAVAAASGGRGSWVMT